MAKMADAGMQINAVLMILNLLPLPPLDGGRIAVSLLPAGRPTFAQLEPYGFPILLLCCSPVSLATSSGRWWPFSVLLSQPFLDFDNPCSLNASSPACAPPGGSTSATTTASSKLGQAAGRVPLPVLRGRLACADDRLRQPEGIEASVWEIVDWLAAGVDPSQATIFIQSRVPEHAELHLLMSMMTPQGWLERVPTYKDQQEKLAHKDLTTYGFLGYPLLMSADILIYRADKVPVGEDQLPHVEFTRELARRFNHMYGREPGFEEKAKEAIKKLGSKRARLYEEFRTRFQQNGDEEGLASARRCSRRPRIFRWATASVSTATSKAAAR
jgi:hypothetical protein